MHDSPHAVNWINNLCEQEWDLHLFPFGSQNALPQLQGVTVHRPFLRCSFKQLSRILTRQRADWWREVEAAESAIYPHHLTHEAIFPAALHFRAEAILNRISVRLGESEARTPILYGARVLATLIRKLKPDLIHSMEFQHCGYNVLRARELIGAAFPPWLASNWGSDIYHYQNFDDHRAQITRLLKHINFYFCECERDVTLARVLGMHAKSLPVMPNSGGFNLASTARLRNQIPTSRRRIILIKGYQHFAGRAMTALAALEKVADVAKNFEVVIFSAREEVTQRAAELSRSSAISNITILNHQTHEEMLKMHAKARVYLGVSISDAISTSALEAMAMGAFPIQTNTSCCDEWFEHGTGGYLIPKDDVDVIAARLRSALTDDRLVDEAARVNWLTVESRLDEDKVKQRVVDLYDNIFKAPNVPTKVPR